MTTNIDEMSEEEIQEFEKLHSCKLARKPVVPQGSDFEFFRLGYIDLQQRVAVLESDNAALLLLVGALETRVENLERQSSQPSTSTESESTSE